MSGPAALAGLRVVELADASGQYCGKLLADMGADVVKVEPPGGDPARTTSSAFFLYANTNKRSVVLDLESEAGRKRLCRLALGADVVLDTAPPGRMAQLGVGGEGLRMSVPALVTTSITGFGCDGPHAHRRSDDIVASALGGAMHVTGHGDDPPVVLAGTQAWISASTCAAAATLIAVRHARRTGCGQHVDVSVLEVMTAVTHICGVGKWLDDGIVPRRLGTGLFASVPSGAYRCRDGLVYLMVNRPAHWQALARWVHEVTGNQEVLDPMFDGPSSNRLPYRELLDIFITEMTERFTVEQVYREGQARHLAFTPVNGALDVVRDPHLAARGFFVEVEAGANAATAGADEVGGDDAAAAATRVDERPRLRMPGAPYRHSATPWRIARAAPAAGEHGDEVLSAIEADADAREGATDAREPGVARAGGADALAGMPVLELTGGADALAGVRVLELTAGMAGPWIGRFLAYCGADVIKVESRSRPDVTRLYVPPRQPELGVQSQLSPWFTDWNAGKRFVSLDLTRPEAVDLCKRLVAHCDVVVANYSAGVLAKLGLSYPQLRAVRPDVVFLSSTGFGETGPCRGHVTWGPNIEALSASSSLSGFPERECTITQFAYPDALSALHGLVAVLCALQYRDRSGEGQSIDLSQYEVMVAALGASFVEALAHDREPQRSGNRSRAAAPHGVYRCAGLDRWCAISVRTDDEWAALCAAIGRDDLARTARFATATSRLVHADAVDEELSSWTRTHDAYDVTDTLQRAGVAAGVVQTVEDQFVRDEQLRARCFFERIAHAKNSEVTAVGIPLRFSATPGRTRGAGQAIGAHNDEVFAGLLGMSGAEIARYVALGAIEQG